MPRSVSRRVTAAGTLEPAEAEVLDVLQVVLGEARVVEQAGYEVGRPTTERDAVAFHQVDREAGIPDVAQVDRRPLDDRNQEGAEHSDEVSDRERGE